MKNTSMELVRLAKALVSGTDFRTIRGTGWTEGEALRNALKRDEEEFGHGDGYGGGAGSLRQTTRKRMLRPPKPAKKVTVERAAVRKGPVEKKFIIERKWGFDRSEPVDNDPKFRARYDKQGEVLRAAKELALQYGTTLVITLAAFCVGNTQLAVVTPQRAEQGEWEFECEFRS